jgi:hypothetical protein
MFRSTMVCFSVFAAFASAASSQDLSNTVLPITDFKLKLKKKSIPSSVVLPQLELERSVLAFDNLNWPSFDTFIWPTPSPL